MKANQPGPLEAVVEACHLDIGVFACTRLTPNLYMTSSNPPKENYETVRSEFTRVIFVE